MSSLTTTQTNAAAKETLSLQQSLNREQQQAKPYLKRLCNHITGYMPSADVLVMGCGYGWLAAALAKTTLGQVTGMDADEQKIMAAVKLFIKGNLSFEKLPAAATDTLNKKFDMIILDARHNDLQETGKLLTACFPLLSLLGEVHVITGNFSKAFQRLAGSFRHKVAYQPSLLLSHLQPSKDAFCHIIIKNNYLG